MLRPLLPRRLPLPLPLPLPAARRHIHLSLPRPYPRQRHTSALEIEEEDVWDMENNMRDFEMDDIPTMGHEVILREREYVHYMRLIEVEGPLLESMRKPYVPVENAPLRIRTLSYGGEFHPASAKSVLIAPVSSLPLPSSPRALRILQHLAGPRWTPEPPTDAGVTGEMQEREGGMGWVKIACEDFGVQSMNVKMCSDMLDRLLDKVRELVAETEKKGPSLGKEIAALPLDVRHLTKRAHKTGRHKNATKRDFPIEWIPEELREQARMTGVAR